MAAYHSTYPRQFAILGALGCKQLTLAQIAEHLMTPVDAISAAASRLVLRGYIARLEKGQFELTPEGTDFLRAAPGITMRSPSDSGKRTKTSWRSGTLRQRAWNGMRIMSRFSIPDILTIARNETDRYPANALQKYFMLLKRGGYLRELPTRQKGTAASSNGFKQYTLIKDTGPFAPSAKNNETVLFDHNTKQMIKLGGAHEKA